MVLEYEKITKKITGEAFVINFGKKIVEFKRIVYIQKSAFNPRQSAAKKTNDLTPFRCAPPNSISHARSYVAQDVYAG